MALMRYLSKACQTFFCVFGLCYGVLVDDREQCTGELTGFIERKGHSICKYVLTQTDTQLNNTYYQLDHIKGTIVVYGIRKGQRSYEPLINLQSDEFKQRTKQEAQIECERLCAELLTREIEVGKLNQQDMIDLAAALIQNRHALVEKKSRQTVFCRNPVRQTNPDLREHLLTLDMLKQGPVDIDTVNQPDPDTISITGSDKVSTASGSTPIISDESDGSKTTSINGDISDPAGSDVANSDLGDQGSECGSVETNSTTQEIQEVTIEDAQISEVTVNSVGVNTDVSPTQNLAINQVNYTESEVNLTKPGTNFNTVDYKKFNPNLFIQWLLGSIERSRIAMKALQKKLLGKIEM